MGYALAAAARRVSESVTLVSGPTNQPAPAGVEIIPVVSAAEMAAAVFTRFAETDVLIMAAAVGDWRPAHPSAGKLKKGVTPLSLELEPTVDILAELGRRKQHQLLVGFAVETDALETHARDKLERKNLDLIVANDVSAFEADTSRVVLLGREGTREALPALSKEALAARLVAWVTGRTP